MNTKQRKSICLFFVALSLLIIYMPYSYACTYSQLNETNNCACSGPYIFVRNRETGVGYCCPEKNVRCEGKEKDWCYSGTSNVNSKRNLESRTCTEMASLVPSSGCPAGTTQWKKTVERVGDTIKELPEKDQINICCPTSPTNYLRNEVCCLPSTGLFWKTVGGVEQCCFTYSVQSPADNYIYTLTRCKNRLFCPEVAPVGYIFREDKKPGDPCTSTTEEECKNECLKKIPKILLCACSPSSIKDNEETLCSVGEGIITDKGTIIEGSQYVASHSLLSDGKLSVKSVNMENFNDGNKHLVQIRVITDKKNEYLCEFDVQCAPQQSLIEKGANAISKMSSDVKAKVAGNFNAMDVFQTIEDILRVASTKAADGFHEYTFGLIEKWQQMASEWMDWTKYLNLPGIMTELTCKGNSDFSWDRVKELSSYTTTKEDFQDTLSYYARVICVDKKPNQIELGWSLGGFNETVRFTIYINNKPVLREYRAGASANYEDLQGNAFTTSNKIIDYSDFIGTDELKRFEMCIEFDKEIIFKRRYCRTVNPSCY